MARKKLSYKLIKMDDDGAAAMYSMLNRVVEAHHGELTQARIALAWARSWNADADGRVKLGQCKRVGDPEREMHGYDFVIILRALFWQDGQVTDEQREALLDHELCHAAIDYDADLEPKRDQLGRICYRIRKHDVEEFTQIIARRGVWKRDLEAMAQALERSKQRELFAGEEKAKAERDRLRVIASDPEIRATGDAAS